MLREIWSTKRMMVDSVSSRGSIAVSFLETYYAAVSGYGNHTYDVRSLNGRTDGLTGTYQIQFSLTNPTGDGDNTPETAQNLGQIRPGTWTTIGSGVSSGFEPHPVLNDEDFFQFSIEDYQTMTWTATVLTLVGGRTPIRFPEVELLDSTLVSIAKNIGGSNDRDATITSLLSPGTYFLRVVGHYNDVRAGREYCSCSLAMIATSIDTDGTTSAADAVGTTSVSPGQSIATNVSRWIGTDASVLPATPVRKDVDLQKFRATQAGVLRVSASSMSSSAVAAGEKVATAITVFDTTGKTLAQDVPLDPAADPELRLQLSADQVVYVAISHRDNVDFSPGVHSSGSSAGIGRYLFSAQFDSTTTANNLKDDSTSSLGVKAIQAGQTIVDLLGRDGSLIRDTKDVDLFRLDATKSESIRIRLASGNAGTNLRVFTLVNGVMTQVAAESPLGYSVSEALVNVTAGATYYLGVNGQSSTPDSYDPVTGTGSTAGDVGFYSLSLTPVKLPSTISVTSPGQRTEDTTPAVSWNADANSASYEVRIRRQSNGAVVALGIGITGLAWSPATALADGDYIVNVRGLSSTGDYGSWSPDRAFNVTAAPVPAVPVIVGPSGTVLTLRPTISWNAAVAADTYDVWVDQIGGTQQIIRERAVRGLSLTPSTSLPSASIGSGSDPLM